MIVLILGRLLQVLLSVVQIRIATMMLPPHQYGIWILLQTVVAFFVMFFLSPIGLYLNRHLLEWDKKGFLPEVFINYNFMLIFISIFGGLFFIILQYFKVVELMAQSIVLLSLIMLLLMFSQTFHQTWVPALNFFGKRKQFVLGTSLSTIISLVLVLVFSKLGWSGPEFWAIAFSAGFLVAAILFIPKSWYGFNDKRNIEFRTSLNVNDIFQFSFPLFFSTLLIWFQTQGHRFFIEKKIGLAVFGQFAAGYAVVAGLFAALEMVIISFYQPRFYKGLANGHEVSEELKEVWDISLYPFFLAMVFLYFLAPEIAKLFLHHKFIADTNWISFAVLSEGSRVIFNTVCLNFHATKKTTSLVIPHLLGVTATLLLFVFTTELTYFKLAAYLGTGYLVSILMLLKIDYLNFKKSQFFYKTMMATIPCLLFYVLNFLISKQLAGNLKVFIVTIIGFVFMLPYYKRNMRGVL